MRENQAPRPVGIDHLHAVGEVDRRVVALPRQDCYLTHDRPLGRPRCTDVGTDDGAPRDPVVDLPEGQPGTGDHRRQQGERRNPISRGAHRGDREPPLAVPGKHEPARGVRRRHHEGVLTDTGSVDTCPVERGHLLGDASRRDRDSHGTCGARRGHEVEHDEQCSVVVDDMTAVVDEADALPHPVEAHPEGRPRRHDELPQPLQRLVRLASQVAGARLVHAGVDHVCVVAHGAQQAGQHESRRASSRVDDDPQACLTHRIDIDGPSQVRDIVAEGAWRERQLPDLGREGPPELLTHVGPVDHTSDGLAHVDAVSVEEEHVDALRLLGGRAHDDAGVRRGSRHLARDRQRRQLEVVHIEPGGGQGCDDGPLEGSRTS